MFRADNIKAVLVAASFATVAAVPMAYAENPLLTPETGPPTNMPQQPTLEQEYANPKNQKGRVSSPSAGLGMPGLPGIQPPTGNSKPGTRALSPPSGGIVFPEGIPSSVRIGPVYNVPLWQRALLGTWLTLQLAVLVTVAVALQIFQMRFEKAHGGHIINPETTEAFNVHRHAPHTP